MRINSPLLEHVVLGFPSEYTNAIIEKPAFLHLS